MVGLCVADYFYVEQQRQGTASTMGAGTSKQQIGEMMKAARRKLEESTATEEQQYSRITTVAPETLRDLVQSVEHSLKSFSPFPAMVLLLAFKENPERVEKALTECCRNVLAAPIQKERYEWFMQYVFASTVWF